MRPVRAGSREQRVATYCHRRLFEISQGDRGVALRRYVERYRVDQKYIFEVERLVSIFILFDPVYEISFQDCAKANGVHPRSAPDIFGSPSRVAVPIGFNGTYVQFEPVAVLFGVGP